MLNMPKSRHKTKVKKKESDDIIRAIKCMNLLMVRGINKQSEGRSKGVKLNAEREREESANSRTNSKESQN